MQRQGFHSMLGHILLCKGNGNFTETVGAEVKADYNVVLLNFPNRVSVLINPNNGFYKLIG